MKKIIKIVLCLFMFICLFSCKSDNNNETIDDNNNTDINEENNNNEEDISNYNKIDSFYDSDNYDTRILAVGRYNDFVIRYLKNICDKNENEIIAPLSMYYAMAILTNAADGKTRLELENTLGMNTDDLNNFLYDFDKWYGDSFVRANALWFNNNLGINLKDDFVNTIKKYYGPSIYESDFNNSSQVVKDVNKWVSDNTNKSINEIIDSSDVDKETPFLILNTLLAGEKWMEMFNTSDTFMQAFNCYDKSVKTTEMMHQNLNGYWNYRGCEGFVKELNNFIKFVAILPKDGMDVYEFIDTMDGNTFNGFINNVVYDENMRNTSDGCKVDTHITRLSFPKFEYEKEYDVQKSLEKMGLKDIFDYTKCDFSNLAEGNQQVIDLLFVKKIKQKCNIKVNEKEVIAAAVTLVAGGLGAGGCFVDKTYYHDVVFDRPFVYALVYMGVPLFVGVVTDLGQDTKGAMQIKNITGTINIRSKASTKGEIKGHFEKNQILFAYETKANEGYTWYRIGDNKWVADKNGEWIKVINN